MCAFSFSLHSPTSSSFGPLCLCPRLSFLLFLYPSSQKSSSILRLKLFTLCYWLMCLYLESFQEFSALCQESGAHSCLLASSPLPSGLLSLRPQVCPLLVIPISALAPSLTCTPEQPSYPVFTSHSFLHPAAILVVVQSLNHVWLWPHGLARQAPLSFRISQSLLKFMSVESVMLSNHLILYHPLLLLPSIFPSIRIFSSELTLPIMWPKYWSFNFNISPSNEHSGLVSFRNDWFDLLPVQETLKSLL